MTKPDKTFPLVSELTRLSIEEVLAAAVNSSILLAEGKQISIKYRRPKEPVYVLGDDQQLMQVLKNLLINAIRFGSPGDKVVVEQDIIQGKRRNDVSDFVRVGVRICGLGISKEMFDIVIEKFQNLRDLLRTQSQNTSGFELSYAQEVIKNFGGNIWVKSQLGKGLSFYFTLPIAATSEKPQISKNLSIPYGAGIKGVQPVSSVKADEFSPQDG